MVSEDRGQELGRKGGWEGIQECTAGQLPWQVDEVRITWTAMGVINARGNAREGKNKAINQPLGLQC